MSPFDVLVIGAGPGGYVCAFRAAQLGLRVGLVEKEPTLGGTCLNIGCIPSKALLHSTEVLVTARDHGAAHGLSFTDLQVDLAKLLARKDEVVKKLTGGIAQLAKGRKVEVLTGRGRLLGNGRVEVTGSDGAKVYEAKNIVIATGSAPVELPFLPFDRKVVVSSTEALAFTKVPKRLVVVGGGAIGLELGSVWARLGSDVTIVEFLPRIAATYDDDITRVAERIFKKQGLKIETGTQVTGLKKVKGGVQLLAKKGDQEVSFSADVVLVAVGRMPFTEGLGLEAAGVTVEKRRIVVDHDLRTNVAGVWAIGDVVTGPMLAHKAEEEGVAVAERIAGHAGHVNYDVIPNVIYTDPEIAAVGLTEAEAKSRNLPVKVGKFNLAANGRALATDATDGLVKIIAHAETDRLLGVQVISRHASELIASAVAHLEYGGSAEDLGRTVHAHPTLSEALKEAALAVDKAAIHAM